MVKKMTVKQFSNRILVLSVRDWYWLFDGCIASDGKKKVNMGNYGSQPGVAYGARAPPKIDLDELCPPQQNCNDCPHIKCGFSDFGGSFDVKPLVGNINYTGLPVRLAGMRYISRDQFYYEVISC